MSAADEAYDAAIAEIERVWEIEATELSFDSMEFRALEQVPIEIFELEGLMRLNLGNTRVAELDRLSSLLELRELELTGTRVRDLQAIKSLIGLRSLRLTRTKVADLQPLKDFTDLSFLAFESTRVIDISPLKAASGLQTLYLGDTPVSEFEVLKALTSLKSLHLSETGFTDLTLLRSMHSLHSLYLEDTEVFDLRPLLECHSLRDTKGYGLHFRYTPFAGATPETMRLSLIEDDDIRTAETMAYLKTLPPWPKPLPWDGPQEVYDQETNQAPSPPAEDPALKLIWGERGFTFLANQIAGDPVAEDALDDLRPLLDELQRKGNRHDDLYRLSQELKDRSAGALPDINMVKLHLSHQKLRRILNQSDARDDPFEGETLAVIQNVLGIIPGLTLSDENVKTLIERQEAERSAAPNPAKDHAADKVLEDVKSPGAPFDPSVKDAAEAIIAAYVDDRLNAAKQPLARNAVIAVFMFVGGSAASGAISGPVGNFIYDNGKDIMAYVATMGDDALLWADAVYSEFRVKYEMLMGMSNEATRAGKTAFPKVRKSAQD